MSAMKLGDFSEVLTSFYFESETETEVEMKRIMTRTDWNYFWLRRGHSIEGLGRFPALTVLVVKEAKIQ